MKLMKRMAASLLLSCTVVCVVLSQPEQDARQVLFSVNGKPVSTDEFRYLFLKNHQQRREDFTREKLEEYLSLFINYKLKVQEAMTRGMDTTASFKKEYQGYRDELLKAYLPDAGVVDSLVRLTYERLKEEVRAAHILVAVAPDASPADTLKAHLKISQLRQRALGGEDFGTLAAAHSEEPRAEHTKGDLGFFTAMQMVYPFEQAAYQTPVGGISRVVRTRFGYHVLKVIDRQPSRGEVEVSHIMIRTDGGNAPEDAKRAIFDVHDKLQKGMPWEELCLEYSEDNNSKAQGGRLRPFGVGTMGSVPEFEEMAFALQEHGQISDPFQTRFGWHILRLESKIALPPFSEVETSLTSRVSKDERVQISRQALRERKKIAWGYRENESVKSKLRALADSTPPNTLWPPLPAPEAGETLFELKGQPFKAVDFVSYANTQPRTSSGADFDAKFNSFLDAAYLEVLEEQVRKESPDYRWLLKEYYEGILLFEIMEKEVWNRATEDTLGQRKFFDANASRYLGGQRISGTVYTAASAAALDELRKLLVSGDTTAASFKIRSRIREETGLFGKDDRPVLAKIEWSPGFHQTENNNMNYLIFIDKIIPPGPKSFQEARSSVISDYQTHLEKEWIDKLRKKYPVRIYKKARKAVFEGLLK